MRARLEGVHKEMRRFAGVEPDRRQIAESLRSWERLEYQAAGLNGCSRAAADVRRRQDADRASAEE